MLYFVAINENENKKEFKLRLTNQYLDGLGNIKIIHVDNKMGYMKYVFSLEFDLNRKYEKDKLTGKDIICPRFQVNGGKTFKRKILLNKIPKKNNYFLYDFEFSENNHLNICQKFNLFKDAFFSKDFNPKYPDNIEREFFWDSMENLIDSNNKFSLKLFLELLDTYYKKNEESNILLKSLENNWDYIFNCEKLDSKYSEILINLEKKFGKEHLRKSVRSINSQNIELFNNLIFIYRTIHEREKIQDMINRESYSGIYAKIIVKKLDFYLSLGLKFPKILIKKLLGQDNLSHVKIIKLLSFGNSVIDIIDIIINNFYKLCNSCIKQKFIIKMTNFNIQKKTDDLEKLISYINQLIEHELKMKYLMVSFNEKFWSFYVNYYKDNNDFKKLKLIEKAILNCKKVDNNLDINKFSNIIHETEIKMIKNGELKNEKILDFFKENYIIGNENTYNIEFPLFFLDGIDLETIDETYFSKWREMNIISYVNSNIYDFCKKITEKINTIDDFGKLFDLFRNNEISAIIIMKNFLALEPGLINILMEKFQNLIKPYDKNKTNKFINYTCLLIDLIDYTNQQNSVQFLNIILKKIDSNEIKNNIIFNLLSKSNLSINLTSFIILYFLRNNNKLDNKIESLIKSKLKGKNNKQIIKFLYDEVNKLIIKEEDIFNEEKSIEFFILLKNIQDITDYQMLAGIGPINNIINLKNKIFFNLKNGNIKYKLIHLWLNDNEKKNLFIERLYILSLNQNEINDCLNSLENYFNQINEDVKITKK